MKVRELPCANVNDFSMIVPSMESRLDGSFSRIDGRVLDWAYPPVVEYIDNRSRGKKKRPVADVGAMQPGVLILSERAERALGPLLGQFGQMLKVQTSGGAEFRFFYNVTNLVGCVDMERSKKTPSGAIWNEVFYDINIPRPAAIFKDPSTAMRRIYTNDAGKSMIDRLATEAGLTGIECGEILVRPTTGGSA